MPFSIKRHLRETDAINGGKDKEGLIYCQPGLGRPRFFGKFQFQHTISVHGFGSGFIHFLRQRKASRLHAVVAFVTHGLAVFFPVFFFFQLVLDRNEIAFNRYLDVFF